jgi:hypothetical protein
VKVALQILKCLRSIKKTIFIAPNARKGRDVGKQRAPVPRAGLLDMKSLACKAAPLVEATEAYRMAMSHEVVRE